MAQSAVGTGHPINIDLQGLLRKSSLSFVQVDTEGKIVEWSPKMETLLHFSKEEICGVEFMDLITVDFIDGVRDMIEKVHTLCHWVSKSMPLYTKEARRVEVSLHVVADTQSQCIIIIIEPLSFSARNCKTNSLWMEVQMPAVELDLNGMVMAWNMHMVKLTGFTAQDLVGRSFLDLHTSDTLSKVRHMLQSSCREAGPSHCTVTLLTISGLPKPVRIHAVALRNTEGLVISTLALIQPIIHTMQMDAPNRN